MGHIFMTFTKSDQFCDPPLTPHPQKWVTDLLSESNGMAKHVTSFKTSPNPLPCGRLKCMVPYNSWAG